MIMSDREALNQAFLLHLWWPHSEVSLRAGDKRGDICTLYEELRTFRGAGVKTTPNYLRRPLRNVATLFLYHLLSFSSERRIPAGPAQALYFVDYRCVLNIPVVK
jgi:hypothetical protein